MRRLLGISRAEIWFQKIVQKRDDIHGCFRDLEDVNASGSLRKREERCKSFFGHSGHHLRSIPAGKTSLCTRSLRLRGQTSRLPKHSPSGEHGEVERTCERTWRSQGDMAKVVHLRFRSNGCPRERSDKRKCTSDVPSIEIMNMINTCDSSIHVDSIQYVR